MINAIFAGLDLLFLVVTIVMLALTIRAGRRTRALVERMCSGPKRIRYQDEKGQVREFATCPNVQQTTVTTTQGENVLRMTVYPPVPAPRKDPS